MQLFCKMHVFIQGHTITLSVYSHKIIFLYRRSPLSNVSAYYEKLRKIAQRNKYKEYQYPLYTKGSRHTRASYTNVMISNYLQSLTMTVKYPTVYV